MVWELDVAAANPPAIARVTQELLDDLRFRCGAADGGFLVFRTAVDRLRVLLLELLARGDATDLVDGVRAIAQLLLAVDQSPLASGAAHDGNTLAARAGLAFQLHEQIEELIGELLGQADDADARSWEAEWHRDCDEQRVEHMTAMPTTSLTPVWRHWMRRSRSRRSLLAASHSPRGKEFIAPRELEFVQDVDAGSGLQRGLWLDAEVGFVVGDPSVAIDDFREQARTWFRLNHPNLLRLFGACDDVADGRRLFVCERAWPLEVSNRGELWPRLLEIARALKFLHKRGVVRGNLRRDQLLVGDDGAARLTVVPCQSLKPEVASHAVRWQAPELHGDSCKPSPASDVYAFGVCIIELASGRDQSDLQQDQQTELPTNRPAMLTGKQWGLVRSMCRRDPSKRPDMAAVVHQLEHLTTGSDCSVVPKKISPECSIAEVFDDVQELAAQSADDMAAFAVIRLLDLHAQLLRHQSAMKKRRGGGHVMRRLAFLGVCGISGSTRSLDDATADKQLSTAVQRFRSILLWTHAYLKALAEASEELLLLCASRTEAAQEYYELHVKMDVLCEQHPQLFRITRRNRDLHEWKTVWDQQRKQQTVVARQAFESLKADDVTRIASLVEASVLVSTPEWYTPPSEVLFDARKAFGKGAFGSAHLGTWLDTPVVVKNMEAVDSNGSDSAAFRQEVSIWHRLNHPHVVRLFGACHHGRHRFFVCEHAPHGQLGEFLRREYPDETQRKAEAWRKLHEAALGLQYLHERGVLHQDLKGDNILVGSDGRAKLADFGLSTNLLQRNSSDGTQIRAGAPRWKAPEVLRGDPPAMEADVFSLGMCVLEAVSGEFPWGSNLPDAAVAFHVRRNLLPPRPKDVFSAGEWCLIEEMCRSDSRERLPLAVAVQALGVLAAKTTLCNIFKNVQ